MTDETEHDKQYSSGCEFTDDYLARNFELFNFTEDYCFIEKIGIRLSYDEALIYSQLPAFHSDFLEQVYPWYQLRACLHCYSQGSQEVVSRLKKYFYIRERKLNPVLQLKEVIELVFPFEDQAGLSIRNAHTPEYYYQKHENHFIRRVTKLLAGGRLHSLNTSSSAFYVPAVADDAERLQYKKQRQKRQMQYPEIVINLSDLEQVSYLMPEPINQKIVKIWRQYLDSQDAELKQNDLVLGHSDGNKDELPEPWLLKEAMRERKVSGKTVDAAYKLFRKRNGRNHEKPSELFCLLTPEDLPDFVEKRVDGRTLKAVEVTLVDGTKWNYQNFLSRLGDLLK